MNEFLVSSRARLLVDAYLARSRHTYYPPDGTALSGCPHTARSLSQVAGTVGTQVSASEDGIDAHLTEMAKFLAAATAADDASAWALGRGL